MNVLLVSTYELGHQPFGLASPAAWLRQAGFTVTCLDLSREPLTSAPVEQAAFIAFYLPMHTATRLAIQVLPEIRKLNSSAHLCFYGLYAAPNAHFLRQSGAQTILGGEFEAELVQAAERVRDEGANGFASSTSMARLDFIPPDRQGLPSLGRYARLELPDGTSRIAGYTEASRGCKHLCRHCPVVPVYNGRFRIVAPEVVLEDVRCQVGAGAQHITFGDPDFFNGIRHAVRVITDLHRQFPNLSYDATIKIEHLLKHREHLRTLRDTGCLFVTSAVESVDERVLERLEKGHTAADFRRVAGLFREAGLALSPTFVAFTPWISLEGYAELLDTIAGLDLIDNVASVQLGIRLLIPAGSRLLEREDVRALVKPFDASGLVYPWNHPDDRVGKLYREVQRVIRSGIRSHHSRREIFDAVRKTARRAAGVPDPIGAAAHLGERGPIPYLSEPWYCCAEPAGDELAQAAGAGPGV